MLLGPPCTAISNSSGHSASPGKVILLILSHFLRSAEENSEKLDLCDEVHLHRDKVKLLKPGTRFQHLWNAMFQYKNEKIVVFCEMYAHIERNSRSEKTNFFIRASPLVMLSYMVKEPNWADALAGREVFLIVGKADESIRQQFNRATRGILFISTSIGGYGVDLTAACIAYMLAPCWNPQVCTQQKRWCIRSWILAH